MIRALHRALPALRADLVAVIEFGSAEWSIAALEQSVSVDARLLGFLTQDLVCDDDYSGFECRSEPGEGVRWRLVGAATLCTQIAEIAYVHTNAPESCYEHVRIHAPYQRQQYRDELMGAQPWTNISAGLVDVPAFSGPSNEVEEAVELP